MKKSTLVPAPARTARRIHATLLKPRPKAPITSRGLTPLPDGTLQFQSTTSSAPAEGAIKLEVSTLSAQGVFSLLSTVDAGLATTPYYPNFPAQIKTAVTTGKEAVLAAINNVAAAEAHLRTLRAALEIEAANGRNALRTAAAACESIDRTDEAIVSVGWTLRRTAGRPRPVDAPAQLSLKNTAFEGEAEARWSRISNVQFYEVKAFTSPTGGNPDNIPWDTLPVIPVRPASLLLKDRPVGSYLTVRVRAVGAKGPSPWTETATVRVY